MFEVSPEAAASLRKTYSDFNQAGYLLVTTDEDHLPEAAENYCVQRVRHQNAITRVESELGGKVGIATKASSHGNYGGSE